MRAMIPLSPYFYGMLSLHYDSILIEKNIDLPAMDIDSISILWY
jgi:hypothetical protein